MYFFAVFDHIFRTDHIAQTPSGDGEGLGQGVAGDGVLIHTGQRSHTGMHIGRINHMLIHFVGYGKGIIF